MAEVNNGESTKIISFYLPQYHRIPLNDRCWGEGFTEWTNVKKAAPLFEGHNQPRIPLNDNYYNLLDSDIQIWQSKLAKEYGIFGFCYYHYWFKDGQRLLEKPAELMLQNQEIELPFCFCWANENWSKNWDGGNREITMEQKYGDKKDWELHFQYLLPFFKDNRYITVDGKPLFVIYKPEQIIDIADMIRYMKKRVIQEGFPGICFAFQFPSYYSDMYYQDGLFDYRIEFEPVYSRNIKSMKSPGTNPKVILLRKFFGEKIISKYRKRKTTSRGWGKPEHLTMYFYDETWHKILNAEWKNDFLPGCFVDWDNTPRNKHGLVFAGYSVEKFASYFKKLLIRADKEKKPMLFINAWNEWGEGAYLEPDVTDGYRKLEAIRDARKEIIRK